MGREVVRAVSESADLALVAAVDTSQTGTDAGTAAGLPPLGIPLRDDLPAALSEFAPSVMVDFTVPAGALANVETALRRGVAPVVGTTGLSAADLDRISQWCEETNTPALIAPNFAIGAVLMMQFAAQAALHFPDVEIIELHHEKKLDSPSGTALLTAGKIADSRRNEPAAQPGGRVEKLPNARGADFEGIPVHSVRLPGFVAHQEVIFGGIGQILTIRHDSTDRRSFMPGVLLSIRRVRELTGLTVGLENLL
jgi:4-hydroxy-tetrahydrodipicolinate reductase